MNKNEDGGIGDEKGFQLRKTPVIPSTEDVGAVENSEPAKSPVADLDRLGELPHSYGSDTLFLVAQEPYWLFTYWDIDISHHPGGQAHLRVLVGGDQLESEIEVPFESRNWYIPVKEAGATYTVEIGYYRGQSWKTIARSVPVKTPAAKLSESDSFEFANIPLHLSFQKLSDSIHTAIRSGESLLNALSRLQKDGQFTNSFPDLASGQRFVLEALLGSDLLDELTSGSFGSEEIETRIRTYLEEKLSSPGASDLLSSELFAGLSSMGLVSSGEHVTSWNAGSLSSWAVGALSSWTAGHEAGTSWGAESSFNLTGASSWTGATSWTGASSWNEAVSSSFGVAALSSWLHALQSSWFQAAQTSWAGAALSSWNQAALTSWSQAAVTSWASGAGASENLSSFGQTANREFFMHVNAEVIFYGGTDPRASVTVDGKPIKLNPDGTFRYHFIFPDGTYEIPIVATSPDGVETRSAILKFDRGTQKQGGVDDTAQPPLGSPMGGTL